MMTTMKRWAVIAVAASMILTAACGGMGSDRNNEAGRTNNGTAPQSVDPYAEYFESERVRPLNRYGPGILNEQGNALPLLADGNEVYVPLREFAQLVGYNYDWDGEQQVFSIGDTDPIVEIKMNSTQAMKEEDAVQLSNAPVMLSGAPHLALSEFEKLFRGEIDYTVQGSSLIIQTDEEGAATNLDDDSAVDESLDFADDETDPASTEDDQEVWLDETGAVISEDATFSDDTDALPVLKNININGMIRTARKYLGVKYKFGAKPYAQSKRFDCSTFTRHVFGKYGISLPRTARAQAKRGKTVSRKKLRKGDLMYFYVPGRFKKEKTIGHVGIYIGNQKMIHASPKPKNGVQITNINKAYWKRTFVKAKRIAY